MLKKISILFILLSCGLASAYLLQLDSVTVDSIWVSDSAPRISRDCNVSFKPICTDSTDSVSLKSLVLSTDGASTWSFLSDSLLISDNDLTRAFKSNRKSTVRIRVLGGDRSNVAIKVTVTAKFSTFVWSPEARWEKDSLPWEACGAAGNIDGPRREVMWRRGNWPWGATYSCYDQLGWPITVERFDPTNDRYHAVAGSAYGFLDGPFSRARFRGQGYLQPSSSAISLDGRYFATTDPLNDGAVRVLDLDLQIVFTLLPPKSNAQAMVINSAGRIIVLCNAGRLVTFDIATKQKIADITLSATQGLDLGAGRGLALDEEHGKLYASGIVVTPGNWHVWYFDLNDGGSFHGVLSGATTGPNAGYTGSFDGYSGYPEPAIMFGPDDPEKRFLYMKITDTGTFLRLDLVNRMVAACSGPPANKLGPVQFIESGIPNGTVSHAGPGWLPDGSIVMPGVREGSAVIYKRVK